MLRYFKDIFNNSACLQRDLIISNLAQSASEIVLMNSQLPLYGDIWVNSINILNINDTIQFDPILIRY